jgi:hypothetical protein
MPLIPTPARLKRAVEASRCVTNGIHLGCSFLFPVDNVNSVQTRKVRPWWRISFAIVTHGRKRRSRLGTTTVG